MKKIDALIGSVGVVGVLVALALMLHDNGYHRGYAAARVTCPETQAGERLRYVEQPYDERLAVCVYGQAYAAVSIKRAAK